MAVGNDALTAEGVCVEACRQTGGLVLPALYFGTGGGHLKYPATVMIGAKTLSSIVCEVLHELDRLGFRLAVLFVGHCPPEQNDAVRQGINEFKKSNKKLKVWSSGDDMIEDMWDKFDHGGKWETSILMHLHPEMVDLSKISADAPDETKGLEEMNAPGPMHGIWGKNPRKYSTKELGEQRLKEYAAHVVKHVNAIKI